MEALLIIHKKWHEMTPTKLVLVKHVGLKKGGNSIQVNFLLGVRATPKSESPIFAHYLEGSKRNPAAINTHIIVETPSS